VRSCAILWLALASCGGSSSGGSSGGVASRDELVRRAFTAVTAGNVDALVALADHEALAAKVMECEPGGALALTNKVRDSFRNAVECARGLDAEVRAIREGRSKPRHAGDRAGSCKFSRDVTTLELEVDALVARQGKPPRAQTVALNVVEVGGGWYLLGAPKLGTPYADEAIAKMTAFRDAMCGCTDKACADRVTDDMAKWSLEAAKLRDPGDKLDEADTKRFADISMAYGQCQTKATSSMPSECEDYRLAIERVATCDKLPAVWSDALKQAFETMSQNWGSMTDPMMRKTMGDACRAATDALNQAMSSLCP
jgi:hypothetical protein